MKHAKIEMRGNVSSSAKLSQESAWECLPGLGALAHGAVSDPQHPCLPGTKLKNDIKKKIPQYMCFNFDDLVSPLLAWQPENLSHRDDVLISQGHYVLGSSRGDWSRYKGGMSIISRNYLFSSLSTP
jgi:hypothetical protein